MTTITTDTESSLKKAVKAFDGIRKHLAASEVPEPGVHSALVHFLKSIYEYLKPYVEYVEEAYKFDKGLWSSDLGPVTRKGIVVQEAVTPDGRHLTLVFTRKRIEVWSPDNYHYAGGTVGKSYGFVNLGFFQSSKLSPELAWWFDPALTLKQIISIFEKRSQQMLERSQVLTDHLAHLRTVLQQQLVKIALFRRRIPRFAFFYCHCEEPEYAEGDEAILF